MSFALQELKTQVTANGLVNNNPTNEPFVPDPYGEIVLRQYNGQALNHKQADSNLENLRLAVGEIISNITTIHNNQTNLVQNIDQVIDVDARSFTNLFEGDQGSNLFAQLLEYLLGGTTQVFEIARVLVENNTVEVTIAGGLVSDDPAYASYFFTVLADGSGGYTLGSNRSATNLSELKRVFGPDDNGNTLSFSPGLAEVLFNGSKISSGEASTGAATGNASVTFEYGNSTVVLNRPIKIGDTIEVKVYNPAADSNRYLGEWDGNVTYNMGDILTYNGDSYMAEQGNTNSRPSDNPESWSRNYPGSNTHNFNSGDVVIINGNDAANGKWVIEVINPTTFVIVQDASGDADGVDMTPYNDIINQLLGQTGDLNRRLDALGGTVSLDSSQFLTRLLPIFFNTNTGVGEAFRDGILNIVGEMFRDLLDWLRKEFEGLEQGDTYEGATNISLAIQSPSLRAIQIYLDNIANYLAQMLDNRFNQFMNALNLQNKWFLEFIEAMSKHFVTKADFHELKVAVDQIFENFNTQMDLRFAIYQSQIDGMNVLLQMIEELLNQIMNMELNGEPFDATALIEAINQLNTNIQINATNISTLANDITALQAVTQNLVDVISIIHADLTALEQTVIDIATYIDDVLVKAIGDIVDWMQKVANFLGLLTAEVTRNGQDINDLFGLIGKLIDQILDEFNAVWNRMNVLVGLLKSLEIRVCKLESLVDGSIDFLDTVKCEVHEVCVVVKEAVVADPEAGIEAEDAVVGVEKHVFLEVPEGNPVYSPNEDVNDGDIRMFPAGANDGAGMVSPEDYCIQYVDRGDGEDRFDDVLEGWTEVDCPDAVKCWDGFKADAVQAAGNCVGNANIIAADQAQQNAQAAMALAVPQQGFDVNAALQARLAAIVAAAKPLIDPPLNQAPPKANVVWRRGP
jgi:hypothetical protein